MLIKFIVLLDWTMFKVEKCCRWNQLNWKILFKKQLKFVYKRWCFLGNKKQTKIAKKKHIPVGSLDNDPETVHADSGILQIVHMEHCTIFFIH